jgi:alkylation response protein AidB-like acyl-CoA dehydrogenase
MAIFATSGLSGERTGRSGAPQLAADPVSREIGAAFTSAVAGPLQDLPLPGGGQTRERWAVLSDLAGRDLSLGRLAEGYADAVAILAELGGPAAAAGTRWGVWAAQPPGPRLTASQYGGTWHLHGTKQYCSGAHTCTHALVTATAPDGERLFAAATDDLVPVPGSWQATGMAASDTMDMLFDDIAAVPVGQAGDYISRPGFAHGGAGVAACWYGGARAIGAALLATARQRDIGPHALAHLGAVDIALSYSKAALDRAAAEIDADPQDQQGFARARTLRLRAWVEEAATDVMRRVGQALGAGPLCHDAAHSRRVADLTVYLRQHHAERSLAELGELVAESGTCW